MSADTAAGPAPAPVLHAAAWMVGLTANPGVTELTVIPGRAHSLTIDAAWGDVADVALRFVQRFT